MFAHFYGIWVILVNFAKFGEIHSFSHFLRNLVHGGRDTHVLARRRKHRPWAGSLTAGGRGGAGRSEAKTSPWDGASPTCLTPTNYNIRKMTEPEALRPETQKVQKVGKCWIPYEFRKLAKFHEIHQTPRIWAKITSKTPHKPLARATFCALGRKLCKSSKYREIPPFHVI